MVQMESDDELAAGDPAPDFECIGTDGATYTPESFAGNDGLLIVFTCNHCPYAKAKIDVLNGIAADYDDVAVVGINPNDADEYPEDSYERMCEVVDEGTVAYDAYLRDDGAEAARAYSATCTPDPFLFRREQGEWRLAYHGRLDDAMNPDDEPSGAPGFEMREHIDAVLAGDAIDEEFKPSRGCSIKWPDE